MADNKNRTDYRVHMMWMVFILVLVCIGLSAFGDKQAQHVAGLVASVAFFIFVMGVL